MVSTASLPARLLASLFLLATLSPVLGYGPAKTRHGQNQRVAMSSIKALTFYDGSFTSARRTDPVPQLTCVGKACKKFRPDVVQCSSMGNGQWKCEADLPQSLRLGRTEVSCEGWTSPDDPYVLKDSCGLTYHLLPAYSDASHSDYAPSSFSLSSLLDKIFPLIFIGVLLFIIRGFITSLRGNNRNAAGPNGRGGWPWGGGGGGPGGRGWGSGWGPGWGGGGGGGAGGPPPPYMKSEPGTSTNTAASGGGWRPGFWTGMATAAGASLAANALRGNNDRRRYEDRYAGQAGGGLGAGWTGGGGMGGRFDDDDRGVGSSSSSPLRTSTGYGGTRNR